jgi:hypothetical protein
MKHVHTIKPTPCPGCSALLYTATHRAGNRRQDTKPIPGDPGVCRFCGTILMHTGDGLRRATADDIAWLRTNCPAIHSAVAQRSEQVSRQFKRQKASSN